MDAPQKRTELSILVISLIWAGLCSPVVADVLSAEYSGSLKEERHTVLVEPSSHDLLLRVRREIRNVGTRVDEAQLSITLPPGAVATGLRSKQGNRWVPAQLLGSEEAAETFKHFTTTGSVGAYGPALLSWEEEGSQTLRIFPVAPGDSALVEYELRVPTCYRDGRRVAFYPRVADDSGMRSPRLRLTKGAVGRIVRSERLLAAAERKVVDACWEAGLVHAIDSMAEYQIIVLEDALVQPVNVRFGLHSLEGNRSIGELVVELAPRLEQMPKDAELVFVLDASISQGEQQLKEQLMLVQGYLAHLPDARFQLVVARRRAETLFDGFQPASKAPRILGALRARPPSLGNGSNLDVATGMAASLLATETGRPQRIIAFTDARLRKSLVAESMQEALARAPGALLHVIDFYGGDEDYKFERDDGHFLAPAVMATGGMWVTMFGQGNATVAANAILGLVRPTSIDSVSVEDGKPWGYLSHIPEVMPEGFGFRAMSLLEEAATHVTVRGKVWGRDFSVRAEHDSSMSQQIPAMAFGRSIESELNSRERLSLARLGQVVSPETSFLARKPGLAPSGYDYEGPHFTSRSMGFSSSHSSSCGGGMVGYASGEPSIVEEINYGAAIAGLLEGRAASCATMHDVSDARMTLQVETTGREIVEVEAGPSSGVYGSCVAEAAWELRLGEFFQRHDGRVAVAIGR